MEHRYYSYLTIDAVKLLPAPIMLWGVVGGGDTLWLHTHPHLNAVDPHPKVGEVVLLLHLGHSPPHFVWVGEIDELVLESVSSKKY